MASVFIIGATGGIGRRLGPLLVQSGHKVIGLHRKPEQAADLSKDSITPVHGDIIEMNPKQLAKAAQDAEVIVFSAGAAGSGIDRTTAIDGDGPIKVIEAAKLLGIARLYLVSAFPEAFRQKETADSFEHYMFEKKRAEVAVAASDLDWVILRPGVLLNAEGEDTATMGPAIMDGSVARGTVARTLNALIEQPSVRRQIIELTDGPTPIKEAVAALRQS
jgi:uncharacterized protein YbjT (DUF2867 family)